MSSSPDDISPFSVPTPKYCIDFAEGEPSLKMHSSVGAMVQNLANFSRWYLDSEKAIDGIADPLIHHSEALCRETKVAEWITMFAAVPGIQELRQYALANYGEDITCRTANRFLGDLIRCKKLSIEQAKELLIVDAVRMLVESLPPVGPPMQSGSARRLTDGPHGGKWIVLGGERNEVKIGTVYALLAHFWNRSYDSYEALCEDGGVFPSTILDSSIKSRVHEANQEAGRIGLGWHLKPDAVSRNVTKVNGRYIKRKERAKSPRKKRPTKKV